MSDYVCKPCMKCKYYGGHIAYEWPDNYRDILHACKHPNFVTTDLVTGTTIAANCREERSVERRCGLSGLYWEPKDETS